MTMNPRYYALGGILPRPKCGATTSESDRHPGEHVCSKFATHVIRPEDSGPYHYCKCGHMWKEDNNNAV